MDQLLPIATAFGLALFHSLWIGGLLYVAVRAIFPLLKTPAARHHLAYGALLSLVPAFGLSTYFLYDPTPVCENLLATATPSLLTPAVAANHGWSEWIATFLPAYAPWLSALYLVGLLPALIFLLRDQGRVQALRTQGVSELPGSWAEQLGDELARHPTTRRVRYFLSEQAGEVMTLGFWSPIIVFPVALVNELSPEMARTILLHEIAHLRHYDHWLNYPQQLIRTFFFFHPAAHALCRLIDREREHRCDDWVAARCTDRRTYATALVTVARSSHVPQNHLVMSATKTPFSARIQRLFLGEDRQKDGKFIFTVLLAVLLGLGHFSYVNLGEDAGAANCLEEQSKANNTAFTQQVALLRAEAAAVPSDYELSKLNLNQQRRWAVVDPATELASKPCPSRIQVENLPFIAAPEPPASSSPRAMERYEKARRKYENMRALPSPEQIGLSQNAIVPPLPCRKIAPLEILPIKPRICAKDIPKAISTARITLTPTTSALPSKIAIFIDGARAEAGPANELDPNRIESIDVIKGDSELSEMNLEGFNGAIMIITKDSGVTKLKCSKTRTT
jgi:beta-lactamase regulating signal transducer with metallopeptidase domain